MNEIINFDIEWGLLKREDIYNGMKIRYSYYMGYNGLNAKEYDRVDDSIDHLDINSTYTISYYINTPKKTIISLIEVPNMCFDMNLFTRYSTLDTPISWMDWLIFYKSKCGYKLKRWMCGTDKNRIL